MFAGKMWEGAVGWALIGCELPPHNGSLNSDFGPIFRLVPGLSVLPPWLGLARTDHSYSQTPYTGWAKKLHGNGKVALLGALKDGKPSGLWTWWDEDGKKEQQTRWKDGVEVKE